MIDMNREVEEIRAFKSPDLDRRFTGVYNLGVMDGYESGFHKGKEEGQWIGAIFTLMIIGLVGALAGIFMSSLVILVPCLFLVLVAMATAHFTGITVASK